MQACAPLSSESSSSMAEVGKEKKKKKKGTRPRSPGTLKSLGRPSGCTHTHTHTHVSGDDVVGKVRLGGSSTLGSPGKDFGPETAGTGGRKEVREEGRESTLGPRSIWLGSGACEGSNRRVRPGREGRGDRGGTSGLGTKGLLSINTADRVEVAQGNSSFETQLP